MGAPNGYNAPTSRSRNANAANIKKRDAATKQLEEIRATSDQLSTANYIRDNFDSLAYIDSGGYAPDKSNKSRTHIKRGDNPRRKKEKSLRSDESKLRSSFSDPQARSSDRAELFRNASQPRTQVSSLFERAATTRRRRKNEGNTLSASDALGL